MLDQGSNDSCSSMATSEMNSDSSDSDHQKVKKKFKLDVELEHDPISVSLRMLKNIK